MKTKYIFVTGGVVSSLGKGITAASLGRLLKARGLKVSMQKFDPYINLDPSLMSPLQHGEVFVTDDGAEADLDLGHYERFIDETLTDASSTTAGRIYWTVLQNEREGKYHGGTVQVIPHITNEIKNRIQNISRKSNPDIVIVEIGGTVGDIECLPFHEAIRQFRWEVGSGNCCYLHVTLLPFITASGELKTKPTQHSVKALLSIGIQPDIIVCRSDCEITRSTKEKIALFCNVLPENVISNYDARSLYEIPLNLEADGLAKSVIKLLGLETPAPDLAEWRAMVASHLSPKGRVKIALVGKYVGLHDAYLSGAEALTHAGIAHNVEVDIEWIQAESVTDATVSALLGDADAIFIPGGFGDRGADGMITAVRYARENNVPFFGNGFGMQLAVVEFARHVLGRREANTTELDPVTPYPIVMMPEGRVVFGEEKSTMRLGAHTMSIIENTLVSSIYGVSEASERHRHRYEINPDYAADLATGGMVIAAQDVKDSYIEAIELTGHPWFVGVSYQPEFKSRPNRAHPLFREFIGAALKHRQDK